MPEFSDSAPPRDISKQSPPIEQRVLLLEPDKFNQSLIWRRQKFAKLNSNQKLTPQQQNERQALAQEIRVITDRAKVLKSDSMCENSETVRERLAEIEAQSKLAQRRTGASTIEGGLSIRRKVLEARLAEIAKTGPIIRTLEAKKWKAVEQHNGIALPPEKWEQLSPRLKNNPDATVSEKEEFDWYLSTLSPERRKEIRSLSEQMKPIDKSVRAIVCIPAHKEGENIYRTLENFVGQKETNKRSFDYKKVRIVVFDNWPERTNRDQTGEEVRRFMKDHPQIPIDYVKGVFDRKVLKIANIRNLITAAAIQNASINRKGASGDLIYVSNDADIPTNGIKPTYIADIIHEFDTHPRMDALAGKIDFPEKIMDEVPVQLATRRLWQYIDSAQMHKRNNEPFLVGRNSALRLKMVAAVGNYDPRDGAGEDVEIGNKIKWVRKWNKSTARFEKGKIIGGKHQESNRVRYVNRISLDSDPRRDLVRILGRERIGSQYSDFEKNQTVRGKSGEQLADMAVSKGFGDFDRALFEKEAAHFYWDTKRWGNWGGTDSFDRAMRYVGAKYEMRKGIGRDGKPYEAFHLTDTERLEKGLQEHRFRYEFKEHYEKLLGTKIKRIEALRRGANNQVFKVGTADGRDLIVRMSKNSERNEKFDTERKVIGLAAKQRAPVPNILAVDTTRSVIPGWSFSVSEKLPGIPPQGDKDYGKRVADSLLYHAGGALRKVHQVQIAKGFGILNSKLEGFSPSWEDYVLQPFRNDFTKEFVSKGIISQADINEAITIAQIKRAQLKNVHPGLLHGDFSLGNMLIQNGKISGLLDFENASSGDPLWDIAHFRNYTADSTVGKNGIGIILNGYGKPDLLSTPENWGKYNLYRLSAIMYALEWQSKRNWNERSIKWLNLQMRDALTSIKSPPPSPVKYSPDISMAKTESFAPQEKVNFNPISKDEINGLLRSRFEGAVQWFRDFYEKGQSKSDQEYATARERYQEIRVQINNALSKGDELSKNLLLTALKTDPNVSLSTKELKGQIDRLVDAYRRDPKLFGHRDLNNPAYRFLVYARNRGRLSRYERSYQNLPSEVNFINIAKELAREKAAKGETLNILDEGGTLDLGIQQLAEKLSDEIPGIKMELSSIAADNMANIFADNHRIKVNHQMADVHHLTDTFKKKQALIISEAAYKFFWDPVGAIRETANALEAGGWAFLGDIQESVSYSFDKLFVDENGKPKDPVDFFKQLNGHSLGYTFYPEMHRTGSMGDDRRVLTLAIKKTTDKNINLPLYYGQKTKTPNESAWISPIVYISPDDKSKVPSALVRVT